MWILGLLVATSGLAKQPEIVPLTMRGYLVPVKEVAVTPKVAGMIVKLNVEEGKRVKKGDVLALLDDRDFKLDVQHAQAKLRLAIARLSSAEKGKKDERRIHEAEIAVAEVELEMAKLRLQGATVVAPWDGTILTKGLEVGAFVSPKNSSNGLASRICTMADLTEMEVELAIAERDIHKIAKGQKCKVRAEAYPDQLYMAEVSRIMPVADRAKGTFQFRVRIAIPANDERLRPEMGAVVTIFDLK